MKPSRLTNALLRRAARSAARQMAIQQELTEAFRARYGTTYSDVDADAIIDVLDFGGGDLTVAECDAIMAECGAPRLPARQAKKGDDE